MPTVSLDIEQRPYCFYCNLFADAMLNLAPDETESIFTISICYKCLKQLHTALTAGIAELEENPHIKRIMSFNEGAEEDAR